MSKFDPVKYINTPSWNTSKPGLDRITKLLELLENPQQKLKFVHVAGTNGKGSTCAYISQILIESGYKTGQFTSPYIYNFSERIRINNKNISDEDLLDVTLQVKEQASKFPENDHPTEFELMTAVAFLYFSKQNCEIVVCEVGMGGRLDSTNVITEKETIASVITPIDMDHTNYLGDTIAKIANEKAGIIKNGVAVFSSIQQADAANVLKHKCNDLNCALKFVDLHQLNINDVIFEPKPYRLFSYKKFSNLKTTLLASYQPNNACLAIEVCEFLLNNYEIINESSIMQGIANTLWPARFEIIETSPFVVIDGGHNVQGVNVLIDSLRDVFKIDKFVFIMGVLADKNYQSMVKLIAPYAKKVYTVTPPNPRNLKADKLAECFTQKSIDAKPVDLSQAINIAKSESAKTDVICAFGSLYSIGGLTPDLSPGQTP